MANLSKTGNYPIVPIKKSSAIVKSDKFFNDFTQQKKPKVSQKTTRVDPCKLLKRIEKKVTKIDKILKNSLLFQKKESEKKRKQDVDKSFAEKEKDLEKKKPKQEKGIKLPSPPGLGLFDTIRNYIGNIIVGFFAVRLIDFLPTLLNAVPTIVAAGEFIIDLGGKLLDGLITFVDWGYKAIDGTRQFIKNIGGEGLAQNFDKFTGAIDNLIEIALITALATADSGGDGGEMGTTGISGAAGQVGRSRYGTSAAAARRYAERYGIDAARKKFGSEAVKSLGGRYARSGVTNLARKGLVGVIGKGGAKAALKVIKPILGKLPVIGGLLEFAISWATGDPVGKAAFRGIGAGLVGAVGTAIGGPIGLAIGGFVGGEIGGALYDVFFGGKKPKQSQVKGIKAAGGGQASTRGGKTVAGPAKRTVKKVATRVISVTPQEVNPGASIGGKEKIQKIFPEPTISEEGKTMDPYGYMKSSSDKFSETFGFGGLFSLITKAQLGDEPSKNDYQSAAQGLTAWMQKTFSNQIMRTGGAFAEGGEVDSSMFNYDQDMKNVVAKSIQDSVAPKIDDIINDLMKQLGLKELDRGKKPGEGPGAEEEPTGSPTLVGNTNAEKVFRYLVDKEGFTPEAAAGVIGNLMQESGVNPKSRQLGGGPGRGIMQWTESERWASLSAWANNSGKDPWALETQVEWMIKEMKDYGTYNRIKSVSSYKKAVEIFESEMERAGTPNYPRRYQYAADALASFSSGAGGKGVPLGNIPGNLSEAKKIASSMGLQMTSYMRPGDPGYHGKGRAMDFSNDASGSGTPEQMSFAQAIIQKYGTSLKQLIYTPLGYGIANGKRVGLDHWGEKTNSQHYHHVHVAFSKGGKVHGLTKAILGEKGAEFVIDADSTRALEENYPGFLNELNKADYTGAINVLQSYATYESNAETFIIIPDQDQNDYQDAPSEPQPILMGGGSVNSDMQFEDSLMYG